MSQSQDIYRPTEEEIDMMNQLVSALRDMGDYRFQFAELLPDAYSSILISVRPPEGFDTSGDDMTYVHATAQDISDQFSRNLVVTTTDYSEGGRKMAYDFSSSGDSGNIVQLNPNKVETELPRRAAAKPVVRPVGNQSLLILLEEACGKAETFLGRGFKKESEELTDKLAEVVSDLIAGSKLSILDDEVSAICSDIAHLFFELGREQDARKFLESIGIDSPTADKQLVMYSKRKAELQATDRSFVLKELEQIMSRLTKFTEQ